MASASARPEVPSFRSFGLLRVLNTHAMGLSLAAATAGAFLHLFRSDAFGITTGLPTLLCGLIWARLLRPVGQASRARIQGGWLASIPLAIMNGALSGGLSMAADVGGDVIERFVAGMILGATFGVVFWLPGLLLTLGFFGVPVVWAKRLAERGLAGEEQGERIVAGASVVLSAVGAVATLTASVRGRHAESILHGLGIPFALTLAVLGAALGLAAFASATLRAQRRKRFVRAVSEQRVPGFRIDEAPEGRVLVREPHGGTDYRVTDLEEELVAIDEAGEVLHEIRGRREQRTLG